MKMSKEVKQQLLGEMGSALIQTLEASRGNLSWPPWDVFHRSCDLTIKDKNDITQKAQIKCKVPWVVEGAQSFTQEQLVHYKTVDVIYFICAPVQGKFEEQDIWKGNIYKGNPNLLETRQKKTRTGREMTLIPLKQPNLHLEFTIKDKVCLDLMRELTTQQDY